MTTERIDHNALSSRDIVQLLAVADEGSIRRAAEALGLTQPGLSKNIRQIEARLGLSVFERSTAGATTTEIGAQLLRRGRQVLLELDAIQRDLRDDMASAARTVRIGCGPIPASLIASRALPQAMAESAGVDIELAIAAPQDLMARLVNGDFDFIIASADGIDLPASVSARVLQRATPVFFARAGHPLAGLPGIALGDLANWRLAKMQTNAPFEAWLGGAIGVAATKAAFQCNDGDLLAAAVEKSDMVSFTSGPLFEMLRQRHDLVALDIAGIDFRHNIHCIQPKTRPLSRAAKLVLAQIESVLT